MIGGVVPPRSGPRLGFEAVALSRRGDWRDRISKLACFGMLGVLFATPWLIGTNQPRHWLAMSAVIFAVAALVVLGHRGNLKRVPAVMMLGAVVPIYAAGQALWGGALNDAVSLLGSVRLMGFGVLMLCVWALCSARRNRRWFGWAILGGATVNAIYALCALHMLGDIAPWGSKQAYLGSATGSFVSRNAYATFLAMGACVGVALGQRRGQLAAWIGTVIILIALVQTQSRLGIGAGLLGVGAVMLMGVKYAWGWMALTLGAVGVALTQRGLTIGADLEVRLELYRQVWTLILQRPFTGWGLDTFSVAFQQVHQLPLAPGLVWNTAHNGYLASWSALGLIVGSIPAIAAFMVAWRVWPIARSGASRMARAAIGVIVVVGVHSLGDVPLATPANVVIFLSILAVALMSADRVAR